MKSIKIIDSHAHIYLPEFDADRDKMLHEAKVEGVTSIYMPAIDSTTHAQMLQLADEHPYCISMMGLHPCSVKEDFETELALVEQYLAHGLFIAVGEIGLDFYWDTTFKEQQYKAFRMQIELAVKHRLPVSIHSRNATDECIQVVADYPGLRGVFHCFSGDARQARKIIDLGMLLGIGGVVTFKNSGLDKVMAEVGLGSVVLETDAPYLAPAPYRGKRNQSAYLTLIAEKLASLFGVPFAEVAAVTTANAEKLFGSAVNP